MAATPAAWRRFRSATGISTRMMLGMILGGLAASASEQEGALLKCLGCRARVFDFRVGRAS